MGAEAQSEVSPDRPDPAHTMKTSNPLLCSVLRFFNSGTCFFRWDPSSYYAPEGDAASQGRTSTKHAAFLAASELWELDPGADAQ